MTSLLTSLDEFLRSRIKMIDSLTISEGNIVVGLCDDKDLLVEIKFGPRDTSIFGDAFRELRGRWIRDGISRSDLRDSDTPEVDSGGGGGSTAHDGQDYDTEISGWPPNSPSPDAVRVKCKCPKCGFEIDFIHGHSTDPDAPEASPDESSSSEIQMMPGPWLEPRDPKP